MLMVKDHGPSRYEVDAHSEVLENLGIRVANGEGFKLTTVEDGTMFFGPGAVTALVYGEHYEAG